MKRIAGFIFTLTLVFFANKAMSQTVAELQANAKAFMSQGDYTNAILILNRATQLEPQNIEIIKDLAISNYIQKDYTKALEVIKPALDMDAVDDQCYQIAGTIYRGLDQVKDCEKLYRKGINKFPESGALYNELGELLSGKDAADAITEWEKGIEADPEYSKNYYNACRYYSVTNDKVWCVLYGELFVNMEPMSSRTPEIKTIILDTYKKMFVETDLTKSNKEKNKFAATFIQTMNNQSNVAIQGINPESLTMIRTRFILDWFNGKSEKYPYKLFEYQQQLIKEGMFDAYNQWLFGTAQNLIAYQTWINNHATEYGEFFRFQKGRTFKMPKNQYYR
ncbi:tetratricopeptide repeat protein [Ferruginibacter sp. SUN002]|uniref:tetratricopeptide repeat protein n=1 Tax=Ferruginibacter sp. SUN002 TaxID=2937789 RepID=UPI003D36A223